MVHNVEDESLTGENAEQCLLAFEGIVHRGSPFLLPLRLANCPAAGQRGSSMMNESFRLSAAMLSVGSMKSLCVQGIGGDCQVLVERDVVVVKSR